MPKKLFFLHHDAAAKAKVPGRFYMLV